MLIDHVKLKISAGKGGDGVVRWRKEKGIPFGGPAGGDGGKGGDVYLRVVRDIHALSAYKHKREWEAESGQSGKKRSMHGGNGEDLYLDIPVGSIVYNKDLDIKYECLTEGENIKILRGGQGGLGNEKFKTSTNRAPEEFTPGSMGEFANFDIELDLIADVGIIGLPNAGKSSLLNSLTRAGAKVADYAFTTLEPNLGGYHGYVLADIPGLIEGAAEGKGLGDKFLKHIKRTSALLHLVSCANNDVVYAYNTVRKELNEYSNELTTKKELIVLSQTDTVDEDSKNKKKLELEKSTGQKVLELSILDDKSVKDFSDNLFRFLEQNREYNNNNNTETN